MADLASQNGALLDASLDGPFLRRHLVSAGRANPHQPDAASDALYRDTIVRDSHDLRRNALRIES